MKVLLIPGFWLDASSWEEVVPVLAEAGHEPVALTLPGLESRDADRDGIGWRDHVDAVVAAIDAAGEPVALVGHSGGASVAYGALDRRPEAVVRGIYVDSPPLGEGLAINEHLPTVEGEIPLPEWSDFDESDLRDLTPELRESLRARAVPHPLRVAVDPAVLTDPRRREVPATLITTSFSAQQVNELVAAGIPFAAEFASISDREVVELPTGHWPQLTTPVQLGQVIAAALERAAPRG